MSKISVLDNNMINMIAAGEVIERPASVAKELLENSIDAGADHITLTVEQGGKDLIAVTDNGCGMDAEDMVKAFLPHATSKIHSPDDLCSISTLGFRGEALASIAAVSKLTAVSRVSNSIEANKIEIDCGQSSPIRPCSGACGTTIEVRDIFYKMPGRRKFLRTANTEMTHVNEFFSRIALTRLNLDMKLQHNGKNVYQLSAGQSLRERISQLILKDKSEELIEIQSNERAMSIHGLVGTGRFGRSTSRYQYIFLNGRYIRDKFIAHAIREAYRSLIEPNKYPIAFLFITMDPAEYDVNVHPTKTEVRFSNPNLVHSQVIGVIREKLLSIDLSVHGKLPDRSETASTISENMQSLDTLRRKQRIQGAMKDFFKDHIKSDLKQQHLGFSTPKGTDFNNKRNFYQQASVPSNVFPATPKTTPDEPLQSNESIDPRQKFIQVHDSYIITETEEGFTIIDQHALHERIIYESLCRKISEDKLPCQRLLIPETFSIRETDRQILKENKELIDKLGIELDEFGPATMAVNTFPTMLKKVNPAEFVSSMIDLLNETDKQIDAERLLHEVLDMAACKAAVKANHPLNSQEISELLANAETIERAARCPHGRPTMIKFSIAEMEKQFKRTGF